MPETLHAELPSKQPLTNGRVRAFLRHLRIVGSPRIAARLADGRDGTHSSYFALRSRDPNFAAAWTDAIEHATENLVNEAHRRAVEGVTRFVVQKGYIVTGPDGKPLTQQEYSDRLLEVLLRYRLPELREKSVHHSGTIQHALSDSATVSLDDLNLLTADEKKQLLELLSTVAERRRENRSAIAVSANAPALPAPSGEIVDAEYEEVAEGDPENPHGI